MAVVSKGAVLVKNIIEDIEKLPNLSNDDKVSIYYILMNRFNKFNWKSLNGHHWGNVNEISSINENSKEAVHRLLSYYFDENPYS